MPLSVDSVEPLELISREVLFGNPERANLQVSPDGRHLAWIAPLAGVLNLWVAPVGDITAARAVTRDTARGIRSYFWAYRSDTLLYLRDDGGDEDFHLYALDLGTGSSRDLTPFEKTTAQVVSVSHRQPDSVLVGMNDRDPQWHDIYSVDLTSGKRTLVEANTKRIAAYLADLDHGLRHATRSRPDGGSDLLRRHDGQWVVQETVPFEDTLTTMPVALSGDGSTLYLIDSRERDTAAMLALDTVSGERRLLHEDPRADIAGALVHPRSRQLQAVSVNYLREEWTALDPAIRTDLARLEAMGTGEFTVTSRTLDDRIWTVAWSAAERPTAYYLYERESGNLERLFSTRPALEGKPLVPMWPLKIPARDGLTLVSYLSLPAHADPDGSGNARTPVPMVLLVHGGPWARDVYGYSSYHQWLANRGYAVLAVNYRGSTGFGKAFTNAGNGEWAGKMHDDLLDAVDWAVAEGITSRGQVAIMGGSYGGYAALVGLTFTPDVFACGVDIVGPSNLNTLLETVPPYWASFFEQLALRVGDPRTEEGRALLTERSPLSRAGAIRKPLLIGQGANDPRVKQAESDQIVAAMQENGIPVTYVLYPDEGHGFARPENNKSFNAIAEGFLAACLGGRAEPIGADLAGSSTTVPAGAGLVEGLPAALRGHQPLDRR